jgi:hypothetical protein
MLEELRAYVLNLEAAPTLPMPDLECFDDRFRRIPATGN